MNRRPDKPVACILTISILMSLSAGCGILKSQSVSDPLDVIKADTPWFSMVKTDVSACYSDSAYNEVNTEYLGTSGDELVFRVEENSFDGSLDVYDADDLSAYASEHLDYYTKDGVLAKTVDLREIFNPHVKEYGETDVALCQYNVSIVQGKVVFEFFPYTETETGYQMSSVTDIYDPATGELTKGEPVSADSADQMIIGTSYYTFGNTTVELYQVFGSSINSNVTNEFTVKTAGETKGQSKLSDASDSSKLYRIMYMLKLSDSKALFAAEDYFGSEHEVFTIDLTTGAVSKYTEDVSWLEDLEGLETASYVEGTGNLICDNYGIRKVDFENKTAEYVFRFDYCNINRFDVACLKLASYSDDGIVFAGDVTISSAPLFGDSAPSSMLYSLTKENTNPNAGKNVIKVASVGSISYAAAEAVCVYNDSDYSCFAVIDDRYLAETSPLLTDEYMAELADIENKLAVDINAGDGPDILFNTISLKQFNREDLLVDLSAYIPEGNYFTNVFDAASTDGVLYQMPLTCGIQGISTDSNNWTGGAGMTYDEYSAFVDGVCNGDDPIDMNRLEFFCLCIDNMSDEFTGGGSISFDNDVFRGLASYVNDNINDPIVIEYGDPFEQWMAETDAEFEEHPAEFVTVDSFNSFLREYKLTGETPVIIGILSCDGRGPAICCYDSVAVSARSKYTDGCIDFVKVLLSDEIQCLYAKSDCTPVNIDAYEASAAESMEAFNDSMAMTEANTTEVERAVNGLVIYYVTDADIAEYEALIASCDHMPSTDTAVMLIVREEIQAYFAGQKSLDDVLDLITNRVDLFVSERG